MGLPLNVKKSKCMATSKKSSNPKCNLVSKDPKTSQLARGRIACRLFSILSTVTALCSLFYLIIAYSSSSTLSVGSYLLSPPTSRQFDDQKDQDVSDFGTTSNRNTSFYLEGNFSLAYKNHWVGFPELEHVNCPSALSYPTLNRLYPSSVNRSYVPDILKDAENCSYFLEKYGFGRHPRPTKEEEEFPIAFILLFHKDLDQVLYLLRAIYRSHNVYCLSVDTKSSVRFLTATRAVARCLPNVFLASQLEDIVYGGKSRLMADIHCFRDLLKHPVQWRYIINTPGQQFPLRTNLEMVKILQVFAGTNDILGQTGSKVETYRYRLKHQYFVNETTGETDLKPTTFRHYPPPNGLRVVKCSAYGAFSRQFARFVVTSRLAKDLLKWCEHVYSPDELYWGTLNYNRVEPAPGGYLGECVNPMVRTSYNRLEPAPGGYLGECVNPMVRTSYSRLEPAPGGYLGECVNTMVRTSYNRLEPTPGGYLGECVNPMVRTSYSRLESAPGGYLGECVNPMVRTSYSRLEPAPGGYLGDPNDNPWVTSYSVWQNSMGKDRCLSTFVRDICIFSVADLPMLTSKPYLFANKFYITHHPAALHCLDQRIFNNTVSNKTMNLKVYENIIRQRLAFRDDRLLSKLESKH
ncbi:beta-1,3-galactosyl-o-glycosyl-glycoprotein beta-1,6-n-acetylglucosaminyltransferase-like [Plakobranchus ocellatus]|uniref:Beta-1,3-galactosyl-o-glycosyl-glycoprotein beta-1,6-n-acetylglucosaminyltransferase-like n=1 Tax=Plakobranchus ocellatus TaxID=259542 RepID=A0AAV4BHU8_9GAST|nr:beta-1,3-galactosyl-o-glycosyl-glycoprotein beta-1,6-n-acetylglucosaminyltransferase-like [Plakobranchus ocellatus]